MPNHQRQLYDKIDGYTIKLVYGYIHKYEQQMESIESIPCAIINICLYFFWEFIKINLNKYHHNNNKRPYTIYEVTINLSINYDESNWKILKRYRDFY